MFFEELRNSHCIRASFFDSNLERLGTAEAEPCIEWTDDASSGLHVKVELIVKIGIIEHEATGNHVGMAAHVLRQRMHDDVGAEFNWILYLKIGDEI